MRSIGEASGKITAIRVLPSDGPASKLELTFQGRGTMLGMEIDDIGTYTQTTRSGGVLYCEAQVVLITTDGGIANWTGFAVGKPTGRFPASTWGPCGSVQTASQQLAHLNAVSTVVEYHVDENGNYAWKLVV